MAFFENGSMAGIQAAHAPRLAAVLRRLNETTNAQGMNVPGWRLHPLKGRDLKGHFSVWVTRTVQRSPCASRVNSRTQGDAEGASIFWRGPVTRCPPHAGIVLSAEDTYSCASTQHQRHTRRSAVRRP